MLPPHGHLQNHCPLRPINQPPQGIPCSTCNKMHPLGLGICWMESWVTCANYIKNHLTKKCGAPNA